MSTVTAPVVTGNPYPGLRAFEEGDSLFFFGRDQHVDHFIRRLGEHQFVAAVGLSGSGKSSLVRAGLLPAIRAGRLASAGSRWRFAVMRPGSDPVRALALALDQPRVLGPDLGRLATLESSTFGLINTARQGREAEDNLLVVVDQFEEIFRSQQEKHLDPQRAAHFVNLLMAATEEFPPSWRIFVVITMRSDYLGDCAQFLGLPEALSRAQYLVPRMNREQIREAIEGPAALSNTEFSPELVQRLLADAADSPDQLPLLQHILMRLWERRDPTRHPSLVTLEHYYHPAIQGFDQALNLHAGQVLERLPEDHHPATKRIFQRLTEIGEGRRDRRCPTRISELSRIAQVPRDAVVRIVNHFRQEGCSFLTSPDVGQSADWEVDITHESLIRRWRLLTEWAEKEAESAYWYRRILELLRFAKGNPEPLRGAELVSAMEKRVEWNADWAERYGSGFESVDNVLRLSKEEAERRRIEAEERVRATRLRLLLVAAVLVALMLGGVSLVAFKNATKAAHSAEEAGRQRDKAEDEKRQADAAKIRADTQKSLAEKANAEANRQQRIAESALVGSQREKARAEQFRDEAIRAKRDRESALLAALASAQSDRETSALLAVEAVQGYPGSFYYGPLWQAIYGQQLPFAKWSSEQSLRNVWFPDNSIVITRGQRTEVWNADRQLVEASLPLPSTAIFSPDGRLAAQVQSSVVRIWDLPPNIEIKGLSVTGIPRAFAARARVLATHSSKNEIQLWDVDHGLKDTFDNKEYAQTLAISADGNRVATRSPSAVMRLWEAGSKEPKALPDVPNFLAFLFFPDGTLTAISGDGMLHRISAPPARAQALGMLPTSWIVSEDGKRIAVRNAVQVRIIRLPFLQVRVLPDSANVAAFAFSKDGNTLATVAAERGVQFWDAEYGKEIMRGPHPNVVHLAFSPDDGRLVTGSSDGEVRVWKREPEGMVRMNAGFSGAAFSPDGRRMAIRPESENQLDIVEFENRGPIRSLRHDGPVRIASFTPDGRTLVTASGGSAGTTIIWDWQKSEPEIIHRVGNTATSVSLTNDRRLLARNSGKDAVVRDLLSGRETKFAHPEVVTVVALSPSGQRLVTTTSRDKSVWLWDLRNSATPLNTIRLPERETEKTVRLTVSAMEGTFSLDGKWLAVGVDQLVYVFEAETLKKVTEFAVPGRLVGLDFARDDLMAAVQLVGSQVRVLRYPLSPGRAIDQACGKLTRNLTQDEWFSFFQGSAPRKTCPALPDPK